MKFYSGQTVMLLDTEYKPAGTAVICKYEEALHRYEVEYRYPGNEATNNIFVPEERLIIAE
ncbi:hypothetical protein BH11BAC4_BH11BAC4_24570 [soil metagenome]